MSSNRKIKFKRKKKSKKFLIWLIPVIAAGAAAATVLIGAGVTKDKFWKDTYINDVYAGGKTVEDVNNDISKTKYTLNIKTREGNTESINLDEVSYVSAYDGDVSEIKNAQSPFLWFMHLTGKNNYELPIKASFDENALAEKLKTLKCVTDEGVKDPVDAHIAVANESFTIVEATEGNRVDTEKMIAAVSDALKKGVTEVNIDEAKCYVTPNVYSNDQGLQDAYSKLKDIKAATITLNLREAEEVIEGTTYMNWITTEGNQLKLKDEPVDEFFNAIADKYDTYQTKRQFETTGAGTIEVGGGAQDSYGFLLDVDQTKAAVEEAILSGTSQTVDAYWEIPAKTRNQKNGDIGNTYVEIDISRQHMWYYRNGELFIDTDVRTGTESSAQWTPTTVGVFRILDKQRDKYFRQFQPVVHSDYWMPFNWRGEGIHDATWYSTYGGNLYKYAGSHGCINTPYNVVQKMYEVMDYGTPVIVYRS